jgi:putative ABC transport system substrate-binding protein
MRPDGAHVHRRAFIGTLASGLLAAPLAAEGQQQAGRVHRIGFLGNTTPALEANLVGPFREGLHELGYVEGQNIVIEYRWAEGKYERAPSLLVELLARKVEVIVTAGTPTSLAAQKATTSVPIVVVGVGDPVATGLVASLARPGGNITGLTSIAEALEGETARAAQGGGTQGLPRRRALESGKSRLQESSQRPPGRSRGVANKSLARERARPG